jgi:hypothetical protein
MESEEAVCEIELEAAIQILSDGVVKLERQYLRLQQELLLERAMTKRLQTQDQEKDVKIKMLTRLLDSHELRIADLEAKTPPPSWGATFDA